MSQAKIRRTRLPAPPSYNDTSRHKGKARVDYYGITLSVLQKRFVEEYLIDLNGKAAAIRAGYSPKKADAQASQLLGNPRVKLAVERAMAERSRRTGISADRVLRELAKIAFINPKKAFDFNSATVRKEIDDDDAAAIQAVRVKKIPTQEGGLVEREVKAYDKIRALELIGKHLGIFSDKLNIHAEGIVRIVDDIGDEGSDADS
jgi:phage terminase small subunit